MKISTNKKIIIIFILGCFLLSTPLIWQFRHRIKRIVIYELSLLFNGNKNICSCTWNSFKLKRDNYKTEHLPNAKKLTNNLFIDDKRDLNRQVGRGKLLKIENNAGYKIRYLNNSSKHLTPYAYKILKEMGRRYQDKVKNTELKDSYFELSSVLRTEVQQKTIRKLYPSAATFNNSTHSYGVSFDIAYLKSKDCSVSNRALNEVLNEMQAEDKILICPEKNCLHITVK